MSSSVFELSQLGFNVKLKLEYLKKLYIHEEIIPSLLDKLISRIKSEAVLKDPIIVDENSLVVLDGMHRVEALKRLNCNFIPVCLVDYNDPKVIVNTWWRTVRGDVNRLLSLIKEFDLPLESVSDFSIEKIDTPMIITLDNKFSITYMEGFYKLFKLVGLIEKKLKLSGFKIWYESENDALKLLKLGMCDAIIALPRIPKSEIVNLALKRLILPHKSTRHVIPFRPLGVNVPISLLKSDDIEEANLQFINSLKKKRGSLLPPQRFMGRRYDEHLYVFEGF
ncbi:MAG: ParB N-terminal domain-containing protein [archaeon GB-1867-035]|nr:ParB N-terminal domain-containing protein [Candidatus Culexmicrobium profundum]